MEIRRIPLSKITSYIIFPRGEHCASLNEVASKLQPGEWVREYTLTIRKLEITFEGQTLSATSSSIKSRDAQ